MDGYRVITSKKVLLRDVEDEQEHKVETLLQPEVENLPSSPITLDMVDLSCSPAPDEMIEIPSSPLLDEVVELLSETENGNEVIFCKDINSSEVVSYLIKNVSNAPNEPEDIVTFENSIHLSYANDEPSSVHQNSPDNNSFGSSTAQTNSIQFDTHSTSNVLDLDQNVHVQNEPLVDSSQYLPVDGDCVINLSDSDESAKIPTSWESEHASESVDEPAFGYRSSRVVSNKNSIEELIYYLCPQCGVNCGTIDKWRLHTETEHGFGLLETVNFQCIVNKSGNLCHKCRDCSKMFQMRRGFWSLLSHRISHLPFKDYIACRICSIRYKGKPGIKSHMKRDHKELFLKIKPKLQDSALEHIRFFCPVCKEEQNNKIDWETHIQEQHDYYTKAKSKFEHLSNNFYICSVCKSKVRAVTKYTLVDHIQTHDEFKSFMCTDCDYSSTLLGLALCHVRLKHLRTPNELVSECSLCKATFRNARLRLLHYKKMHKVANQTCKVCKKTFVSSSFLLSHMVSANHHTLK